jgi:ketosteroid isomerase-like protein
MKGILSAVTVIALFAGGANAATDEQKILEVVNTWYDALRSDDYMKFDSVIASSFYAFDVGKRFSGHSLVDSIKAAHEAGKRFEWDVTDPDVHPTGNTAWATWVNKGGITDASGTKKQDWLESTYLEKQGDNWKMVFFHSTRVQMPQ